MMLILLDIDGVMVPANSWKKLEFLADGFPIFSHKSAKALQKIISATDASVLLTTSHKLKYDIFKWQDIFSLKGIDVKHIDRLLSNSLQTSRKDEILNWYIARRTDENFVIIDDDKLLNDLPPAIKNNLVLTSPSVGLTEELAEEAISILMGKNDHLPAMNETEYLLSTPENAKHLQKSIKQAKKGEVTSLGLDDIWKL